MKNHYFPLAQAIILSLTLVGCSDIQAAFKPSPAPTVQEAQPETDGDEVSSAAPVAEVKIEERLLASGVLEIGERNAPVVLFLFTNHDCAYCRTFEDTLMPRLRTDFIQKGILRVDIAPVLLKKYGDSEINAKTFLCGATLGSGSVIHNQLFHNSVTSPAIEKCLKDFDADISHTVDGLRALSSSLDITLIPTYFVNGEKHVGLPEYADLRGQIEEKLHR